MSLKKLFNRLKYERVLGKYGMLRTEQIYNTGEDRNYYIGEEKKNDKIKKINKEELKALNSNDELKEKFGELVTLLDGLGGNVDSNEKKSDESPIEINNPMLYNIVKQFIKTTYEGIKSKTELSESVTDDEDNKNLIKEANSIQSKLVGLIKLIDKQLFDKEISNYRKK